MAKFVCAVMAMLGFVLSAEAVYRVPAVVISERMVLSESIKNDGVFEVGEIITLSITLKNVGLAHGTNISATLLEAPNLVPIIGDQNFGELPTNSVPQTRDFTFQVNGRAGSVLQAVLSIKSNGQELSQNVFDVPVGDNVITYQNLETLWVPQDYFGGYGPATTYPSTINVSGLVGVISGVRVTLHNYEHGFPEDVNALLITPAGTQIMLMSDCGGPNDVTNINLTISSSITNPLPTMDQLVSGVYSATDVNPNNSMAEPAPTNPPYATPFSLVRNQNPNGQWTLFIDDRRLEDAGMLGGGWSLTITLIKPPVLRIANNGDGRMRLVLSGTAGRSFLIDYSTDTVNWTVLGQTSAGLDSATFYDYNVGGNRFYRARRVNP